MPVVLNGSGTIRPAGESITLTDVIIPAGSIIYAENLEISTSLRLHGDSALGAVSGSLIRLENESVSLVLEAENARVPTLNLGNIGADYTIVPQSIRVLWLSPEVERTTLVSGRTLTNCEQWRVLTQLDVEGFTTECVTVSAARLLADADSNPEIALVLVPIKATEEKSDSGNVGAIVGGVVGGLVVLAAIGVGVFFLMKKGDGGSSSGGGVGKSEKI